VKTFKEFINEALPFGARTLKVGPLPKPKPSPIFKYPEKPKSIFNWKK